ncbi:unnamed protein product [Cylindrotheca closterium]|uniref:Uncharacterized protein n=1 Tax=Cylindrotheca closterium TaxID=2856 RepID=A0AAD2JHC9_9STRA|nr:unnamed protein product [Cylindrotheca closterium]
MTAEVAWSKYYNKLPAFEKVQFEQFKARLKSHRQQVKKYMMRSKKEEQMWRRDLLRYPPKTTNSEGAPLWNPHKANKLLRQDVGELRQKKEHMTPKKLQATRDEYKEFPLKIFRQHMYQEIRRCKFCNHLHDRREAKKIIHICKPAVGATDDTLTDRLKELGIHDPEEEEEEEEELEMEDDEKHTAEQTGNRKRKIAENNRPSKKQKRC